MSQSSVMLAFDLFPLYMNAMRKDSLQNSFDAFFHNIPVRIFRGREGRDKLARKCIRKHESVDGRWRSGASMAMFNA